MLASLPWRSESPSENKFGEKKMTSPYKMFCLMTRFVWACIIQNKTSQLFLILNYSKSIVLLYELNFLIKK